MLFLSTDFGRISSKVKDTFVALASSDGIGPSRRHACGKPTPGIPQHSDSLRIIVQNCDAFQRKMYQKRQLAPEIAKEE